MACTWSGITSQTQYVVVIRMANKLVIVPIYPDQRFAWH